MEKNIVMSHAKAGKSETASNCATKYDSDTQKRIVKLKESLNLNISAIEEAWQRLQRNLDVELKVCTIVSKFRSIAILKDLY